MLYFNKLRIFQKKQTYHFIATKELPQIKMIYNRGCFIPGYKIKFVPPSCYCLWMYRSGQLVLLNYARLHHCANKQET